MHQRSHRATPLLCSQAALLLLVLIGGCSQPSASSVGGAGGNDGNPLSVPRLTPKPLVWLEDFKQDASASESPIREAAKQAMRMADLLKSAGQYARAEKAYQEAIKVDPTWSYPHYQLACNYELWGKTDQAVEQFNASLEKGFDDFPTALSDDELGAIREREDFSQDLAQIRQRYVAASKERVGQPIAVRPKGDPPQNGWPVILLLHGYGDTNLAYLDNAQGWAEQGFVAVAVPGSVPASDGRYLWSNESTEPTDADLQQALASPILDKIIDKRRVFLLGFSQGALHAMLLTAEKPETYAGVVGLSPGGSLAEQLVQPQLTSGKSPPPCCYFIHGDEEPHAPLVTVWLNACNQAGWRFASRTHPGSHHFPSDWDDRRAEVAAFLLE